MHRFLLVTSFALALNASAQSTWTNCAGGNWLVASNWSGGVLSWGSTTILITDTGGTDAIAVLQIG